MNKKNLLKVKLKKGEVVFGTWVVIPSPTLVEVLGMAGMDFIIIDLEHGPMTYETSEDMIRASELVGCTPLLRVPHNSDHEILRGLEIGAHGITIPKVENLAEARMAIQAIKYAPEGNRGVSAFTRSSGYFAVDEANRTQKANDEVLTIILLESLEAINNLESIIDSSGIDVIYIGTYDLSQSLGETDNLYSSEIMKILEVTVKKVRDKGIAAGVLAQSEDDIKLWTDLGIQFIPFLVDCGIIYNSVQKLFKDFKK